MGNEAHPYKWRYYAGCLYPLPFKEGLEVGSFYPPTTTCML